VAVPVAPSELVVAPTILRRWRAADAPALVRALGESRNHLRPWMPWVLDDPADLEWRRGWLSCVEQTFDDGEAYDYAISSGDVLLGGCSLHALHQGPLVGYWLHPDHTGQGHATRATAGLIGLARQLGFSRVQLRCDEANRASARVARRLGFELSSREAHAFHAATWSAAWLVFSLDLR
jgi:ribosomal-protein-serine acetyltransferase